MPCIPQKSMWEAARTIQLAHILETNEKPIKTERFPKKSSLEGNKGNIGEKWEIWQVRKITTGKGQVEYYFVVFPTGKKIILGVLEIPCTPQKPKWAAARTIQLAQKLENMKTIKAERFPKKNSLEQNEGNMGEIRRNLKG